MQQKESLDDELKGLSPWLRDLKKSEPGLQVPADYFDTLEARVFAQMEATGGRETPVMQATRGGKLLRLLRTPKAGVAAAAAIVLTVGALWFLRAPNTVTPGEIAANVPVVARPELSDEEIETYLLQNVQDFEPEQLASIPLLAVELPETENPAPVTSPKITKKHHELLNDVSAEDLEKALNGMSDEELERML